MCTKKTNANFEKKIQECKQKGSFWVMRQGFWGKFYKKIILEIFLLKKEQMTQIDTVLTIVF